MVLCTACQSVDISSCSCLHVQSQKDPSFQKKEKFACLSLANLHLVSILSLTSRCDSYEWVLVVRVALWCTVVSDDLGSFSSSWMGAWIESIRFRPNITTQYSKKCGGPLSLYLEHLSIECKQLWKEDVEGNVCKAKYVFFLHVVAAWEIAASACIACAHRGSMLYKVAKPRMHHDNSSERQFWTHANAAFPHHKKKIKLHTGGCLLAQCCLRIICS